MSLNVDRTRFYNKVRSLLTNGFLSSGQVMGFEIILDEAERRAIADPRHLAYMLATVWHETGKRMQPIRELGSEEYLRSKPYYPWVGEGLVQVTWEANARKFGAQHPGDCLTWPVALRALFDGMSKGMFTSHRLSDFFNATTNDPLHARMIINRMDKAAMIADYHHQFLLALDALAAVMTPKAPAVLAPGPVEMPAPAPAAKPETGLRWLLSKISGGRL